MTGLRRPKGALSLGDAVPILGGIHTPTGPARTCQRPTCETRLRRGNPGPYCDPCRDVLHPWKMPEMRTRTKDECPSCGGLKTLNAKQCRECAGPGRSQPYNGGTCSCGRWKNKCALVCRTCYLESVAVDL